MSEVRIAAQPRTEFGKGAARRIRRAGQVPAVVYGHGQQTRHVALPGHELLRALKGGANTLLRLDVDGTSELALPRSVVRDPIKGFLEHLDLLLVRSGETVTVPVSVTLTGEPDREAMVDLQAPTIQVEAEATHIPTELVVDITGLGAGASITAGEVALPAGVALAGDPAQVVVQMLAPSGGASAAGEGEAAGSGEAPGTAGA